MTAAGSWRFRPDIEGLRAVAIIGVILFHAGLGGVPGGFLGVDVFFVLSGFLITGILVQEARTQGRISLPAFWARRARRLLPAATLVSLLTLLFLVRLDSPLAENRFAHSALSFATYWSNLLFWKRGSDYFDPHVGADPFLHTWSLAVEEQYYLLFAPCVVVLGLLVARKTAGRFESRLRAGLLVISLVSLLAFLTLSVARPVFAFYSLPTRAWEFGIGGILALGPRRPERPARWLDQLISLAALAAVVGAWLVSQEGRSGSGAVTLFPVLGTAVLIEGGSRGGTLVAGLLHSAPMRRLGRLSYSWYLWHWPLTVYWAKLVPAHSIPLVLGMPLLSLALAQLTYTAVEAPARHATVLQPARRGLLLALGLATVTVLAAVTTQGRADRRLRGPEYAFILEARDARTRIHLDGCDRDGSERRIERCSYGALTSDTTVVLFGDSHAAQWFPALEPLVSRHRWRLVPFTKPGCPSIAVTVWTSMAGRSAADCERWRDAALDRIRALGPHLVILTNYRWHSLLDGADVGGRRPAAQRPDLWLAGLQSTLARLPASSAILLVEDPPVPRIDVPTCLVEHVRATERCRFARDSAIAPAISQVERDVAGTDRRVSYGSVTDQVCGEPRCPVVRGDTVLYADNNHLSVAFAGSLSVHLRPLVEAALLERSRLRPRAAASATPH